MEIKIPENNFFTFSVCVDCMVKTKPIETPLKDLIPHERKLVKSGRATVKSRQCPKCKETRTTISIRR
jgi:hypothetical protein